MKGSPPEILEKSWRIYTIDHCKNPECRKSFTTHYSQQIYCNDPCKHEKEPKGNPRKVVIKKSRQKLKDNTTFNREWLTKRL